MGGDTQDLGVIARRLLGMFPRVQLIQEHPGFDCDVSWTLEKVQGE